MNALKAIPDLPETRHRRKCHYRVRWFYSKGAFLILLWTFLESAAEAITIHIVVNYYYSISQWLLLFSVFVALFAFVTSGWLADAKLGNYKVMKWALICTAIHSTNNCMCVFYSQQVSAKSLYDSVFFVLCVQQSILSGTNSKFDNITTAWFQYLCRCVD